MRYWDYTKICHWCGKEFEAKSPKARHCPGGKCKQAHHRAYKKYITVISSRISNRRNAHKKRKRKKLLTKRR